MAFPRFVLAGGVNTIATYALYLLLLRWLSYPVAYSLTYACGIGLGYLLNVYWVFKKVPSLRTALPYPLTYALNYVLGLGLLWCLVEILMLPKEVAPVIVVIVSVPLMYLVTRAIFQGRSAHER